MKKWAVDSNSTQLVKFNEELFDDKLKPMVYTLAQTPTGQFVLVHTKDCFDIDALYGSVTSRADKILNTFNAREDGTGILLTGDKGSGKTLLSKLLANRMIEAGYPVILINQAFRGDGFNGFIDDIGICCVLFDEFAKVYASGSNDQDDFQDSLLTFFDGTMSAKRLSIVTENEAYKINDFMMDRPGRMFYHFRYGKLDEETINELCEATLTSGKQAQIVDLSRKIRKFSFDILSAIIEESNRNHDESILSIADDLNVPTVDEFGYTYTITKVTTLNGTSCELVDDKTTKSLRRYVKFVIPNKIYGDPKDHHQYDTCHIDNNNIIYAEDNKFICENNGVRFYVVVTETPIATYTTNF